MDKRGNEIERKRIRSSRRTFLSRDESLICRGLPGHATAERV